MFGELFGDMSFGRTFVRDGKAWLVFDDPLPAPAMVMMAPTSEELAAGWPIVKAAREAAGLDPISCEPREPPERP